MKIGPIIKSLRDKRGITLEQMAHDIGVATSTLSRIETGKRLPSLDLLEQISTHLSTPLSEIFRTAEGHPTSLQKAGSAKSLFEYTDESIQLMAEIQGVPSRNIRLLIEMAKVINTELGKAQR